MNHSYEQLCVTARQQGGVIRLARLDDLVALTATFAGHGPTRAVGVVDELDRLEQAAGFALSWMERVGLTTTGDLCPQTRRRQ